jgi:16S rRNA (uracil1498-N3)-methyltransferase
MHRFFINPLNIEGLRATLSGPEAHHLRNVLRVSTGDEVELYDGAGSIYRAAVEKNGREIELAILSRQISVPDEPSLFIAQGFLKGKKMDFLIQKATELGIAGFFPFHSAHCAVPASKEDRTSRWDKITLEACKQSGRPIPLQVTPFPDLNTLLAESEGYSCKLIFWEKEIFTRLQTLAHLSSQRSVIAVIGPEGGFADGEIDKARQSGFLPVSLGNLTLRAETACISTMAILQYLCNKL